MKFNIVNPDGTIFLTSDEDNEEAVTEVYEALIAADILVELIEV